MNEHNIIRENPTLNPIGFVRTLTCCSRGFGLVSMSIIAVALLTAGLAQPTSAAVGPEGEWVSTGLPAPPANILTLGTPVTIPDRPISTDPPS